MHYPDRSLIVYELNEVPKRVIDYYISKRPKSNLAFLIKKGFFVETFTKDEGELHPWSTWPSVHRGVTNSLHGIKFLNQDKSCSKEFKPVWERLENSGISIGIFGSLQTYPPYISKNVNYFVPDTFSPNPSSFPKQLELFQKFNLALARRNKAYAGKITFQDFCNLFKIIKKGWISRKTLINVAIHLFKEIFDSRYKKRRSNIQTLFSFDVYKEFLIKDKPNYSTFFTNHIAANMHRYWLYTFPEDFEINYQDNPKDNKFNSLCILKAMDLADKQIGFLMDFQESRGGALWIISGLGQEAIKRKKLEYVLFLDNEKRFIEALKLDINNYTFVPSMFPDINIKCKTSESVEKIQQSIKNLKDKEGNRILRERYPSQENTLNLIIETKKPLKKGEFLVFKNKIMPIHNIGLKLISREIGTGYHIKEGVFIFNKNYKFKNKSPIKKNHQLDICEFYKMTLNYFGLI